ncbi:MAG: hypothetical protein ACOYUZ_00245 [Patescibacteria group bacterium]
MSDFLFFEPLKEDFLSLDPYRDKETINSLYWTAHKKYRDAIKELQKFNLKDITAHKLTLIDRERNFLHNQMKELGGLLGKTESEVFADLYNLTEDLTEYQLPEFKIYSRNSFDDMYANDSLEEFFSDERAQIGQNTWIEPDVQKDDRGNEFELVDDLAKDEFGIIFERKISAAVKPPDPNLISTRGSLVDMDRLGTDERIRRAKRFAADYGLKLLKYYAFSHEYTETVYAIVADKDSLGKIIDAIKRSRSEYGIRISDMDQKILELDWQEYQKKVQERLNDLGLGPFARMLYDHVWKRINEPGYHITTEEIISEIEKQGYEIRDGRIKKIHESNEPHRRKGLKAKERRGLEREEHTDDYPESEQNPFRIK